MRASDEYISELEREVEHLEQRAAALHGKMRDVQTEYEPMRAFCERMKRLSENFCAYDLTKSYLCRIASLEDSIREISRELFQKQTLLALLKSTIRSV